MRAQGIDVEGWGGILVGFAPHGEPRSYEGYANWDIGYLFVVGDRLGFVGEQTRFALRHEQITDLRLGPSMPRWVKTPYLYVTWKAPERDMGGTFNLRVLEVRSLRQLARATGALEQKLRPWREQPPAPAELPAALAELSPPSLGEVTGVPVQAIFNAGAWVFGAAFLVLLGAGLSVLCGLPFSTEDGGL